MWSLLFGVASVQGQKFTFGAAGDFSTGANFLSTLDAIKTANVDLMLALGDLAYEDKKVRFVSQAFTQAKPLGRVVVRTVA